LSLERKFARTMLSICKFKENLVSYPRVVVCSLWWGVGTISKTQGQTWH